MELILIYSKASSTQAYRYKRDFPFLKEEWFCLNIAQSLDYFVETSLVHSGRHSRKLLLEKRNNQ